MLARCRLLWTTLYKSCRCAPPPHSSPELPAVHSAFAIHRTRHFDQWVKKSLQSSSCLVVGRTVVLPDLGPVVGLVPGIRIQLKLEHNCVLLLLSPYFFTFRTTTMELKWPLWHEKKNRKGYKYKTFNLATLQIANCLVRCGNVSVIAAISQRTQVSSKPAQTFLFTYKHSLQVLTGQK